MISTVYVLAGIAVVFGVMHIRLIQRYSKTKDKPSLHFGVTTFLWVLTSVFGILIAAATARNNLPLATILYQSSTTSGMIAFVFLNAFATAMAKPDGNGRGIWIAFTSFFVLTFVVWASNPISEGVIGGTTEFTLTSMYKAPYGLPLIEITLALMTVMAIYPIYLFFHIAKNTKERIIKTKSLLMGSGLFMAAIAYSIEVTGAVSYQFMPIYRPLIFVGSFILFFGYMMPKRIERILVGGPVLSEESVRTFVEEFFVHPIAPTIRTQPHAFSRSLGLKHPQMVGRKILLEFDPASSYEEAVHDFVIEALANEEPIIVFTRRGSTVHSSLSEQKAIRFFCLTQQISIPREFSEEEMLLPSNDTSLMLNVFDKTMKAQPEGAINILFDSLSDLVLSIGFDKTYHFTRYAAEMLASPRITALFLVNKIAHDLKVASSLRGLFSNQISFGMRGIQTVKLSKAEVGSLSRPMIEHLVARKKGDVEGR